MMAKCNDVTYLFLTESKNDIIFHLFIFICLGRGNHLLCEYLAIIKVKIKE